MILAWHGLGDGPEDGYEGVDFASGTLWYIRREDGEWAVDRFSGSEGPVSDYAGSDLYPTLRAALSDAPATPEACAALLAEVGEP